MRNWYKNIINFNKLVIDYNLLKANSRETFVKYGRNYKSAILINDDMFNYVLKQKQIAVKIMNRYSKLNSNEKRLLKIYFGYENGYLSFNKALLYSGYNYNLFFRKLVKINQKLGD